MTIRRNINSQNEKDHTFKTMETLDLTDDLDLSLLKNFCAPRTLSTNSMWCSSESKDCEFVLHRKATNVQNQKGVSSVNTDFNESFVIVPLNASLCMLYLISNLNYLCTDKLPLLNALYSDKVLTKRVHTILSSIKEQVAVMDKSTEDEFAIEKAEKDVRESECDTGKNSSTENSIQT
jgi:hypothetical protein